MAPSILQTILRAKRREVEELKTRACPSGLKRMARRAPAGRDLLQALKDGARIPVIAEIKRVSPSAGRLRPSLRVADLAREYRDGGAAALSVLTDAPFFGGSSKDLELAREAVDLPVLRKDFIIDPVQLHQSKVMGADAVLLIAAALDPPGLEALFRESLDLGLTPLLEVHGSEELDRVLALDPALVGINNRDLTTLRVSPEVSFRLRPLIPAEVVVVAESGIGSPEEVAALWKAGLDAFLVGTALMRAARPGALLKRLSRMEVRDG